jgi:CRP-like cAMP-binding protein
VEALEAALAAVSIFAHLRPDEIGRIARRFELRALPGGTSHRLGPESARLVMVVSGTVELTVNGPVGEVHSRMRAGDRFGDTALLADRWRTAELRARQPAEIALLDRAGLAALIDEFPAIALPLAAELASELRQRNDQVREVLELGAAGLPPDQLAASIRHYRRALAQRGAAVRRPTGSALFHRLVVAQGREPPFWVLIGFLAALGAARLVVFVILRYHLEEHFFALIAGSDPNPMHIHHFNYGLALVAFSGLGALFPVGRRSLRLLSLLFGVGCGLVFDEFALFWNLNPDYSQGSSLISAAIVGIVLVQLTYFRRFWVAWIARTAERVRGS